MATTVQRITGEAGGDSITRLKPIVVGIYGVPGSGKTFLLKQLELELENQPFLLYEGSKVIADLVPGGLESFKGLDEQQKSHFRELAITKIRDECFTTGKVGIVAGHLMFWSENDNNGQLVCTQSDMETYTHILYLDAPAEVVAERRLNDKNRIRPHMPIKDLQNWMEAEKTHLRRLCLQHGIIFSILSHQEALIRKVLSLLYDFQHHDEEVNLSRALSRVGSIFPTSEKQPDTVLVLDADRTLAPQDSGKIFWQKLSKYRQFQGQNYPLKALFGSPLGYSYVAFRQATFLYEEVTNEQEFDDLCEDVAGAVTMYPQFVSLLKRLEEQRHIGVLVVTCGLRRVWEKVLEREGLSSKINVIGGGRITDGFVVTAAVKAAIVGHLKACNTRVWAFGDSVLDLPMLKTADQAIVVVGEEHARSKTMEAALLTAIEDDGLLARQCIIPSTAAPRLDKVRLPTIELTDPELIKSIISPRQQVPLQVIHATSRNAAKVLMTPMRDATVAGPALREAHRRVGWYLATEFLTEVIGIEEYPIPHVQGNQTKGYQLQHEDKTTIVALMRGGEPMALGVNDAFPLAMFVHAKNSEDITAQHLAKQRTVILVDSVVNSGKTIVEFVKHIRNLSTRIQIVVVTGVLQAQSVSEGSLIHSLAQEITDFSIIALRISDNKFTGKGTTDTGNRLFNSTQLP